MKCLRIRRPDKEYNFKVTFFKKAIIGIMKKSILLSSLFCALTSYADVSSVNFLEISLTDMKYEKPTKQDLSAGTLVFTETVMSRSDLTFNLSNKDKVFDSKIFWRNSSLTFNTPYMNLDFKMEANSGFNDISKIDITKSQAIINPTFFSFGGENFQVKMTDAFIKLDNYMIYCTANDFEYDMATAEGIEYGCMTEMSVSKEKANKPLLLSTIVDYEDGDQMVFNANIDNLEIVDSTLIQIKAKKSDMKVSKYLLETGTLDVTCLKKNDLKVFESEIIKKDCENTIDIKAPKVVVNNSTDLTKFYIESDVLSVKGERVQFISPVIQFVDKESSVTTFGLTLSCQKKNEATVYDLHSAVGECISDGNISIDRLVSKDEKDIWFKYQDILKKGFNPVAHIGAKERDVQNVRINLQKNNFLITASAFKKILGVETKFNIHLDGSVEHIPAKDQVVLKVKNIGVPIGWFEIKWKKTLLGIMKKALVGSMIEFEGDKIIIQL